MVPKGSLSIDLFSLSGGPKPCQHPPERLPTVLFIWGPFRMLPIMLTSLSITETAYDTKLNPVRAEVSVALQVLTSSQLAKHDALARGAYPIRRG